MENWREYWTKLIINCTEKGATGRWIEGKSLSPQCEIAPPARLEEIIAIETILGIQIPTSFREVLLTFSSSVRVEWQFWDRNILPEEFRRPIFAGECRWNARELPALHKTYQGWIQDCFNNPNDAYDYVWHNKFPILEIGNGDMLGIELGDPDKQAVVYLSHDDGCLHNYHLGASFQDYVERLSVIGCVGSEEWQLCPFIKDRTSGIQTHSDTAMRWREWLRI